MGRKLAVLFAEIRRRNVFKVAAAYAVVGWLLIQAATSMLPNLGLPPWAVTLVIVLVMVGFPVAIVLGWAYELPPAGSTAPALAPVTADPVVGNPVVGGPVGGGPVGGNQDLPSFAVLPFLNMIGDQDDREIAGAYEGGAQLHRRACAEEVRNIRHPTGTATIARIPFRDQSGLERVVAGLHAAGLS